MLLLVTLWCVCRACARDVIPFTFGWRFLWGDPFTGPCEPSSFPVNLSNTEWVGFSIVTVPAASPCDCALAACELRADMWQWCVLPPCQMGNCSVGTPDDARGSDHYIAFGRVAPGNVGTPVEFGFDDSSWEVVDVPHDARREQPFPPSPASCAGGGGNAGQPAPGPAWYRKHFALPADWQGSDVRVSFDGVFSVASIWLNGVTVLLNHTCGYTSFTARLDNVTGVVYGGGTNILTVFADGQSYASGWWYEGSGIYRPVYLIRSAAPLRIADDGAYAPARPAGSVHQRALPSDGLWSDAATIAPRISVENVNPLGSPVVAFTATVTLFSAEGTLVASSEQVAGLVGGAATTAVQVPAFNITAAELWSVPRPYLYTVVVALFNTSGTLVDSVNSTLGIRSIAWDADHGLILNGQAVKLRGFCDHNNAATVGMAVPQRVNLLRLQQLRGLGGNSLRSSHNPHEPATLDLADALGVTILDENRLFDSFPELFGNMADMVRRDRRHASILWWSSCNEGKCFPPEWSLDYGINTWEGFRAAADAEDGERVLTGNMFWSEVANETNVTDDIIGVQGLSHQDPAELSAFRAMYPGKPVVATECCSCVNERDEDADMPRSNGTRSSSFSQPCTSLEVNWTDADVDYFGGSFVWTLHDYYGENVCPQVNAIFGQIDLAFFHKSPAEWYRSWWLADVPSSDPGRPPVGQNTPVVHILETWQPSPKAGNNRTLHVYTNAPAVRLSLNGVPLASEPTAVPRRQWVTASAAYAPGALCADALHPNGTILSSACRQSWGQPASIELTLDAPSLSTGTGARIYADGEDVAVVRATLRDSTGVRVQNCSLNISFSVASGPGIILGAANGDAGDRALPQAPWVQAFHGLARAYVRVSLDATLPDAMRALRASIEIDAGAGPRSSSIMPVGQVPPSSMTITASTPGLPVATLVIPLSVDPADAPLSVAAASVGAADLTPAGLQ